MYKANGNYYLDGYHLGEYMTICGECEGIPDPIVFYDPNSKPRRHYFDIEIAGMKDIAVQYIVDHLPRAVEWDCNDMLIVEATATGENDDGDIMIDGETLDELWSRITTEAVKYAREDFVKNPPLWNIPRC